MTLSPPTPIPPARALFDLLDHLDRRPYPTRVQIDTVVNDFLNELTLLDALHNRKSPSTDYLLQHVFARGREFKADSEVQAYCRCHLRVALVQLSALVARLRTAKTGSIGRASLAPWATILRNYIFDLVEIVDFLQRKTENYLFFEGHKNPTVHSWQVFRLSRELAQHSAYTGTGPHFDTKPAQIAAIAVLRQALELRFERAIGVYPRDPKGKPPRLRHGFHLEFIEANPRYFVCSGFKLSELQSVYDWSSEIVHQAYQPYAWQIAWAHELTSQLMLPRSAPAGGPWNIANAIEVVDVIAMQDVFFEHFLTSYDHGKWRMNRSKPEALVRGWPNPPPAPSNGFRPVQNPQTLWRDIVKLWKRWGPGRRS